MSNMEFNVRAKFIYTNLLSLVQVATGGRVESFGYSVCDDGEEVQVRYVDGCIQTVDVTGNSLLDIARDVLREVF